MTIESPLAESSKRRYGREDLPRRARTFLRRLRDRRPGVFWGLIGVTAVLAALFVTSAFWLPQVIVKGPTGEELKALPDTAARLTARNDVETTRNGVRGNLLQGIGGLLVLGTLWVGVWTIMTTRRGQDTDRFTKSIDQLGDDKVEIRLGGIYALEQIARLPQYRRQVAEILAAYLRTRSRAGPRPGEVSGDAGKASDHAATTGDATTTDEPVLRADLQAALRVLIVDGLWEAATAEPLDLSYIAAPRANLPRARMQGCILLGANLAEANLSGAQLQTSDLQDADLGLRFSTEPI